MRIAYSHARFIALLSHSQTFAIGLAKTYSVYRLRGRHCENNTFVVITAMPFEQRDECLAFGAIITFCRRDDLRRRIRRLTNPYLRKQRA